MSWKSVDAAFAIQGVTPSEKLTLLTISKFYNDTTGVCNPSVSTISDISGVSTRTVIRSINRLEELKIILTHKTKHANGFENNTTQYELLYLASDNLSSASDTVSPNKGFKRGTKRDEKGKATAALEIENNELKNKIAELEKKAVVAKSENKNSLPDYQKPTVDEIEKTNAWLDSHVDSTPFVAPISQNDIVLTPEQLECFQWAINHDHWQKFSYSKSVFLKTLNNANGGMRNQYAAFKNQQAQKSPVIATYDQQGLQVISSNQGQNYDTTRQVRQPASATAQIDAGISYLQHRYDTTGQSPIISDDF